MTTGVVAFQVIIVISLALARLFSVRHMQAVAVAWVAVTLVAVFTSWLLLLQLVTVIVTYSMLRPMPALEDSSVSGSRSPTTSLVTADVGQDVIRDGILPPQSTAVLNAPEEAKSLTGRRNSYVERQLAAQSATKALDIALSAERVHVEAALELARSELRIAKQLGNDPMLISSYRQAHQRLSSLLAPSRSPSTSSEVLAAPDFNIDVAHRDSGTAEAIRARILSLQEQRRQFLDDCLKELSQDRNLKKVFWRKLLEQKQPLLADSFVKYANGSRTDLPRGIA